MKKLKHISVVLAMLMLTLFCIPSVKTEAAPSYTITYVTATGQQLSTSTITAGDPIGTLPTEADLLLWTDTEHNEVTTATVPTSDMTVVAIHNADVSSSGTLDSGNVKWYISDDALFVTGKGTINILNRTSTGATKMYGLALNSINVNYPSTMYDWLQPTAVGDELSTGFDAVNVPTETSHDVSLNISRPISFTGETLSYPATALASAAPWLNHADQLTSIYFSKDVSLTGNFSLYFNQKSSAVTPSTLAESAYTNLETVYMFADTSGVTRMSGLFARCPKLKNIYVKEGTTLNTDSVVDMSAMFYGDESLICDSVTDGTYGSLKSIIASFSNTGAVTDMRYMFFDCKSLEKPPIKNWDTSHVTDMSYMFTGCNTLKLTCGVDVASDSDISTWDTSNVYSMTGMFAGSTIDLSQSNPITNLWGVSTAEVVSNVFDLSQWDLSKLQVSVYMFAQNSGLTGVKWTGNANALTDSSCMFAWCNQLGSIDFTNLSTTGLKYADAMFFQAGADGSTADFSGWKIPSLEDGRYMFYSAGFSTINMDGTNPAALTTATGMFFNCKNLTNLGNNNLSDWTLPAATDVSYMFCNDNLLSAISTGNWSLQSATDISYMFSDCSSLTALDVSNWGISAALKKMDCAFYNCARVSALNMSGWDVSGLSSAFAAFSKMSALTNANISGWIPSSLQIANSLFAYDYSLASINIGSSTAPQLRDAAGMFYNCISLESVGLKNLITASAENLAYIFSGCANVSNLDLSAWNTSNVQYMQCMFDGMASVSKIAFGNDFSTTSAKSTGAMMRNCSSLGSSSIQSFIALFNPSQDADAYEMFRGCEKLANVDFTSKDFTKTANVTRMFYGDDMLSVITLPSTFMSGVTDVSNNAKNVFYCNTDSLTYLTIKATALPSWVKSYDWNADNRYFLLHNDSSINGNSGTSYKFENAANSPAVLLFDVSSTLYLDNNVPEAVSYKWSNGSTPLSDVMNNISVAKADVGSYTCTAYFADIANAESLSDTFTVTKSSGVTGIAAKYTGKSVIVNNDYNKNEVTVKVTMDDGSSKTLSASEFTLDSTKVTKKGDNTFTAHYTDSDGKTFSANFTVPGVRVIGSIEVKYSGPEVKVGKYFSTNYITCTAYYADDTSKEEGFKVTPTSYDSKSVTSVGDNKFTAYYKDTSNNNNVLSSNFVVKGFEESNIKGISAEYTGPDVTVGKEYDKSKVKVVIQYNDGSEDKETTEFTVDQTTVTKKGNNTFTATYTDSNGNKLTDTFKVKGIVLDNIDSIDAKYNGPDVAIGSDYDRANVTVTIHYNDGSKDATTSEFTVDSTTITKKGTNTFVATVTDSEGKEFTDTFKVKGVKSDSTESSENGNDKKSDNSKKSAKGVKTGDNFGIGGWVMCLIGLIILLGSLVYVKKYLHKNESSK